MTFHTYSDAIRNVPSLADVPPTFNVMIACLLCPEFADFTVI